MSLQISWEREANKQNKILIVFSPFWTIRQEPKQSPSQGSNLIVYSPNLWLFHI